MNLENILMSIILFTFIVIMIITIFAISKQLRAVEDLSYKQRDILMILINSKVKNEESYKTLEKIEKVLVPDWQSQN